METNKQDFFTEWEESFDSFDQMGLHENLLRGIYAYGERPALAAPEAGAASRPRRCSEGVALAAHVHISCN